MTVPCITAVHRGNSFQVVCIYFLYPTCTIHFWPVLIYLLRKTNAQKIEFVFRLTLSQYLRSDIGGQFSPRFWFLIFGVWFSESLKLEVRFFLVCGFSRSLLSGVQFFWAPYQDRRRVNRGSLLLVRLFFCR